MLEICAWHNVLAYSPCRVSVVAKASRCGVSVILSRANSCLLVLSTRMQFQSAPDRGRWQALNMLQSSDFMVGFQSGSARYPHTLEGQKFV